MACKESFRSSNLNQKPPETLQFDSPAIEAQTELMAACIGVDVLQECSPTGVCPSKFLGHTAEQM